MDEKLEKKIKAELDLAIQCPIEKNDVSRSMTGPILADLITANVMNVIFRNWPESR